MWRCGGPTWATWATPAARAVKVIAAEMQRLLGWSDAERETQLSRYLDELAIDREK